MNIVLEGPDNAGKSTLARMIHEVTGWPIQPREGKPTSWENTLLKAVRYLRLDGFIIDRHVIVSQNVYNDALDRSEPDIPQHLELQLYSNADLFIYCRALKLGLEGHKPSGGETEEHMRKLEDNYARLVIAYDFWAMRHAHLFYRDWNQAERICQMVKGLVG